MDQNSIGNFALFSGQFAKYVLRPKPWFLKEIVTIGKKHPGNTSVILSNQFLCYFLTFPACF